MKQCLWTGKCAQINITNLHCLECGVFLWRGFPLYYFNGEKKEWEATKYEPIEDEI